jgi:hypothetical protein
MFSVAWLNYLVDQQQILGLSESLQELTSSLGSSVIQGAVQQLNESPLLSKESIEVLVKNILLGSEKGIDEYAKTSPLAGIGNRTASVLAPEFNSGYQIFIDSVDLPKKIKVIVGSVKKVLTTEINELTDTTTQKIEESMGKVRDTVSKESEKLFRDVTLSALPWIALTGAVVVGVPLIIIYIYHRAKRNMEQEKSESIPIKRKVVNPVMPMLTNYSQFL